MSIMSKNIFYFCLFFILFGTAARLVPHLDNFAPISALALFSGAALAPVINSRRGGKDFAWVLILPVATFLVSDILIWVLRYSNGDFYPNSFWIQRMFDYSCIFIISWLSRYFSKGIHLPGSWLKILTMTLGSSSLFFIVSNFGCWVVNSMSSNSIYSNDFTGLLNCWIAGIPFYRGTMLGDLFYSAFFFGVYIYLIQRNKSAILNAPDQI